MKVDGFDLQSAGKKCFLLVGRNNGVRLVVAPTAPTSGVAQGVMSTQTPAKQARRAALRKAGSPKSEASPGKVELNIEGVLGHRTTASGETEFEVLLQDGEASSSSKAEQASSSSKTPLKSSWQRYRDVADHAVLARYRERKGCQKIKNRKRKPLAPLSNGDSMTYLTKKTRGNCEVCLQDRSDESDPIVYCERCNSGVHASCYGYPLSKEVPEGEWVCDRCSCGAQNERCVLCPMKSGIMKKTTDSRWAHLACAMWVPEVFFRDGMGLEAIDTFQVAERRWLNECCICKIPQGATLECGHEGCTNTFHLSCGMKRRAHLDYEQSGKSYVVYSFCPAHAPFWRDVQERREARKAKKSQKK